MAVTESVVPGRCDGCKHCAWIAPGGQLWRDDPSPQMHCRELGHLDVVARKNGDYAYTRIPAACPGQPSPLAPEDRTA